MKFRTFCEVHMEKVFITSFRFYDVYFNGNMYEVFNKVTENVDVSELTMLQAIVTAKSSNEVLNRFLEEGIVSHEIVTGL